MELFSVFVTGANRGIGLELVRQLVGLTKPPKFVFATYRSRDGIEALKRIKDKSRNAQVLLIKMDVTKKKEIEAAGKITEDIVGEKGLTLLINNAGVFASQGFPQITEENMLFHFKTNTVAPTIIIQEFLPLLRRAAEFHGKDSKLSVTKTAVLNISSMLGSISLTNQMEKTGTHPCYSYKISKAGLNMMGRVIASNVKSQGILVVNMCPGWVKTDMGTERAVLEVQDSVSAILSTLPKLNDSHHEETTELLGARLSSKGSAYCGIDQTFFGAAV